MEQVIRKRLIALITLIWMFSVSCSLFDQDSASSVVVVQGDISLTQTGSPLGNDVITVHKRGDLFVAATPQHLYTKRTGGEWRHFKNAEFSHIEKVHINPDGSILVLCEFEVLRIEISGEIREIFNTADITYRGIYDLIELENGELLLGLQRQSSNIVNELLYRSNDGGVSWEPLGASNGDPSFFDFEIYQDTLFSLTGNGLARSFDNGSTWEFLEEDIKGYEHLEIDNEGRKYLSTGYDIWVAHNGENQRIPAEGDITFMEYDGESTLYFTKEGNFYKLTTGSFQPELTEGVKDVKELIMEDNNVLLATEHGLYEMKEDNISKTGIPFYINTAKKFNENGLIIYHFDNNKDVEGLYVSQNSPFNEWVYVPGYSYNYGSARERIFTDPLNDNVSYTDDYGNSWVEISINSLSRFSLKGIAYDEVNNRLYAGFYEQHTDLYVSEDLGASWNRLTTVNYEVKDFCMNEQGYLITYNAEELQVFSQEGEEISLTASTSFWNIQCSNSDFYRVNTKTSTLEKSENNGSGWEEVFSTPSDQSITDYYFGLNGRIWIKTFKESGTNSLGEPDYIFITYVFDDSSKELIELFDSSLYEPEEVIQIQNTEYLFTKYNGIFRVNSISK